MSNIALETRTTRIWLDADGILRIVAKPVSSQNVSDAEENLDAIDLIRQGRKLPALIDLRQAISTEHQGRRLYFQKKVGESVSAAALIVKSPISRVIGGLFLGLNKPPFPVRLFESEEKTLKFLKGFLVDETES